MYDLASLIQNRQWVRCEKPFAYVHAYNVFTPEFYQKLEAQFKSILGQGLHEQSTRGKFSRSIPGYDAYGVGFTGDLSGPMTLFTSPEWHDMTCRLFNIRGLDYINAGLHYHKIGSGNGSVHNDYNPCWFPLKKGGSGGEGRQIVLPAHELCSYKNGKGSLSLTEKVEVVRAVVMIYYLNNDPRWVDGDGGETGMFSIEDPSIDRPRALVPPTNNSAVFYECTPLSYHSFLQNKRYTRSSVIMWVHRTKQDAISNWGGGLEKWKE
jgi:2OG-Fe(II) oxygenase superfamily